MRVIVRLGIEVDPSKWAETAGLENARSKTISDDIRRYVLNLVQNSSMLEECEAEITIVG